MSLLPEAIGTQCASLANRWRLSARLALDIITLNQWMAREKAEAAQPWGGLWIISGYRSPSLQLVVNPQAPNSLHTLCPAQAADLRLGNEPASLTAFAEWNEVGLRWEFMGHRWGGRFSPPDLNHFDLGPGWIPAGSF